jgi:RNA polymerase sigma factor (sigma-70 family)
MGNSRSSAGDSEIFRSLYPALRRFAAAVRAPGVDADDLVQEALTRTLVARSLASIDDPLAYLRTAVVRVAINATRSKAREDTRIARVVNHEPGAIDAYPSDLDALRSLSPAARAILYLTVVEDRSYREAAEIVGCSEAAARQTAARGLARLRAESVVDSNLEGLT